MLRWWKENAQMVKNSPPSRKVGPACAHGPPGPSGRQGRGRQQGLTPAKNTSNKHLMSINPLQNIIQCWIKYKHRYRVSPSAVPPWDIDPALDRLRVLMYRTDKSNRHKIKLPSKNMPHNKMTSM